MRLWTGNRIDLARHFSGRDGPYDALNSGFLFGYYKFNLNGTIDNFLYNYKTQDTYAIATNFLKSAISAAEIVDSKFDYTNTFEMCSDGLIQLGNWQKCSTLTSAIRARMTDSKLKIATIDFTEPKEYTLHYWFRATYSTSAIGAF